MALLGTADVASFVISRRQVLFGEARGRGRGSLLGLALWSGLAVVAMARLRAPARPGLQRAARVLSLACGVGNLALAGVHLKVRRGQRRAVFGAALGVAAILTGPRKLR